MRMHVFISLNIFWSMLFLYFGHMYAFSKNPTHSFIYELPCACWVALECSTPALLGVVLNHVFPYSLKILGHGGLWGVIIKKIVLSQSLPTNHYINLAFFECPKYIFSIIG